MLLLGANRNKDEATRTTEAPQTTTEASTETESVITSGEKTTSRAVAKTFTSTLPDGGATTLTSTSWVKVVPTAAASEDSNDPDLQNAAPRSTVKLVAAAFAGVLAGAILL